MRKLKKEFGVNSSGETMRESTKGLITLIIVLLLVLGIVYYALIYKHQSHQTTINNTTNNITTGNETGQTTGLKSTVGKIIIMMKEDGTVEQVELFYTNDLTVEINVPLASVSVTQVGKYIDRVLRPTRNLTKNDVINGVIFRKKGTGEVFTPDISEEILPSTSNTINMGDVTIDRYGRDLNLILKSIIVPQTINYVTVKIYNVLTGELIGVKSYRVLNGRLDVGNDYASVEGTFRLVIIISGETKSTFVFAGSVVGATTDTTIDKKIIVYFMDNTYKIKVYSSIVRNGVEYIVSSEDNLFRGKTNVVNNNLIELRIADVQTLYEGKPLYIMFKDGNKYYKVKIKPRNGIFIFNPSMTTNKITLVYPYTFATYTGENKKFNSSVSLVVPIIIVSKYPVTVTIYDSEMNELDYTKTFSTTMVKGYYITIVKVLVPFDTTYKKLIIEASNSQGRIIKPIILNYNDVASYNKMISNIELILYKHEPYNILSLIINKNDETFTMLLSNIQNIDVPKIYLEDISNETEANTTIENSTYDEEFDYNVYLSQSVVYVGNTSVPSYVDMSGIHIDKKFIDLYLSDPSSLTYIVQPVPFRGSIYDSVIPIEYITNMVIVKSGIYTYKVYNLTTGEVVSMTYDELYKELVDVLINRS